MSSSFPAMPSPAQAARLVLVRTRTGVKPYLTPWLLVLPATLMFVALFLLPMLALFVSSFHGYDPNVGIIRVLSVQNYVKFVSDPYYREALVRTLRIALMVTILSGLLGYPVAYYLNQVGGRTRTYLTLAILSPLLVSLVIRTFGWLIILGPNGVINFLGRGLGILGAPLKLMYTEGAVIVGTIHVYLPFMVLALLSSLQNIDPNLYQAASNLGADPLRRFVHVTLPLSLPGILAGSLIVFSLSVSSFVTPAILGGARVKVMAYLVWEEDLVMLNWPFGAAIAFILLVITIAIMLIYHRILEAGRYGVVFQ